MIYNIVFLKMIVVFYTVTLYIYVFMTCSTSHGLYDTRTHGMYVENTPATITNLFITKNIL